MSADDEMRLAELLCARLCHDLAGPIGGAAAGAELLSDGAADEETGQLLAASIGVAARQLNYLRRAFGRSTAPAAAAALRKLAEEFLAGWPSPDRPGTLSWLDEGSGDWPADLAKLILNLLLAARDCLPRGGSLSVRLTRPPSWRIEVRASGRPVPGEVLPALAAEGPSGVGPRGAPAYLAALLARRVGGRIEVAVDDDTIRLTALS